MVFCSKGWFPLVEYYIILAELAFERLATEVLEVFCLGFTPRSYLFSGSFRPVVLGLGILISLAKLKTKSFADRFVSYGA